MSSLPITDVLRPETATDDFALLYHDYAPRVLRYLRGAMRDPGEAEDVMHEVFFKAYRALQERDCEAIGSGWLFTVARTSAIDHARRGSHHQPLAPASIADLADRRRPEGRMLRSHWISEPEVKEVLERLPTRQREIIVLRYVMGCSHSEVARILGCAPDAVRKAHQRALHDLAHGLASSELATERGAVRTRNKYYMGALWLPRRLAIGGFSLLPRRHRLL